MTEQLLLPEWDAAINRLPTERFNRQAFATVPPFRIDLIGRFLNTGDPLADALVTELAYCGADGEHLLAAALHYGLDTVAEPTPALFALIGQCETVASNCNRRQDEAPINSSVPDLWFGLAITAALLHVESSPAIARLLTQTSKTAASSFSRMKAVGSWFRNVMKPDGLSPGSAGYIATIQVRILHARIRAAALKAGWDTSAWGIPINQVDMARTWLDFSHLSLVILKKLGFTFPPKQVRDHYRTWCLIGQLLGIDPTLTIGLRTEVTAANWLSLIDASNREPDANSRALTTALLETLRNRVPLRPLRPPIVAAFREVLRFALGDQLADSLGMRSSVLKYAMPAVVRANRRGQQRRSQSIQRGAHT
jgi:hypothetical protein